MTKLDSSIKLLDDAYKNVRMGSYAIDVIYDKIVNTDLQDLMHKQNKFYLQATTDLERISKKFKHEPKDLDMMLKASSYSGINMKTMFNKKTSHIAEMLIQGTTMGITTLVKEINMSHEADEELLNIANSIVGSQEKFVESLKDFL